MKRLIIASLPALLALTSLMLISPAVRADETTCEGFLGAITVDNLRVPPDASCTLGGTNVQGTIKVENGASLTATQVTVAGNIQAEGAMVVNVLAGSIVSGSIQIKQGSAAEIDDVRVNGDIQFESNTDVLSATLIQVTVMGNVQAEGAQSVNVRAGSIVSGSIQIKQGGAAEIDDVRVYGDILFESNTDVLSATLNLVGGNVQVFKNTGGATIADNVILGNLQCKENDPAPTGEDNLVVGNIEDQCAGLGVELTQRMFIPFVGPNAPAPD